MTQLPIDKGFVFSLHFCLTIKFYKTFIINGLWSRECKNLTKGSFMQEKGILNF